MSSDEEENSPKSFNENFSKTKDLVQMLKNDDPFAGGDYVLNLNHDSIRADPDFIEWKLPTPLETVKGYIVKLQYLEPLVDRYRSIVEEISKNDKYHKYLDPSQELLILDAVKEFKFIDIECCMPDRPMLTDIAKAERHYGQKGFPQGKRRLQKKTTNKEAAILREQAFYETCLENTKLWVTIAEVKSSFMTSIEMKIEQIHEITKILDKQFHHRLERLYLPSGCDQIYQQSNNDEQEDLDFDHSQNLASASTASSIQLTSNCNSGEAKSKKQSQRKRNAKYNKKRSSTTPKASTRTIVCDSVSFELVGEEEVGKDEIKPTSTENDNLELDKQESTENSENAVKICNQSTQTEFSDDDSDEYEDVDDDVLLFEVCGYE